MTKEAYPQHNFFLIIPAFIVDDPKIDDATAILYGRIVALSNQKGFCWASDKYLSDLSRCGLSEVKSRIKTLEDFGYIRRETKKRGLVWERKIYPILNKINSTKAAYEAFERPHMKPSKGRIRGEEQYKPNNINTVPTVQDCKVGTEENDESEKAVCDRLTEHPLFVANTSVSKARSWFMKNPIEAQENLTYLDKELQKLMFTHIKNTIARKLSEIDPEIAMRFGNSRRCLTFNLGSEELKTSPEGIDWIETLSVFLSYFETPPPNSSARPPLDICKIINDIENKALKSAQSDIEKFKHSKNDKVKK